MKKSILWLLWFLGYCANMISFHLSNFLQGLSSVAKTHLEALNFFHRWIALIGSVLDSQLILEIVIGWFPWGLQAAHAAEPRFYDIRKW